TAPDFFSLSWHSTCSYARDRLAFVKSSYEREDNIRFLIYGYHLPAHYFSGALDEGEWFEGQHRYLLRKIPRLAGLLEANETELFRAASREYRETHFSPPPIPAASNPDTGQIPHWLWWIIIWMAMSSI